MYPPLAEQEGERALHRDPAFRRCVKQVLQVAWHKGLCLRVQDLLLIRCCCLANKAHGHLARCGHMQGKVHTVSGRQNGEEKEIRKL